MKPIIIVPPDTLSTEDMQALRDNGLCVVVAKDPAALKFLDPIPAMVGRSKIEEASVQLSRRILDPRYWNGVKGRSEVATMFIEILQRGTVLDPNPQPFEIEQQVYDSTRADEVRKIAREDARAAREQKKTEKKK